MTQWVNIQKIENLFLEIRKLFLLIFSSAWEVILLESSVPKIKQNFSRFLMCQHCWKWTPNFNHYDNDFIISSAVVFLGKYLFHIFVNFSVEQLFTVIPFAKDVKIIFYMKLKTPHGNADESFDFRELKKNLKILIFSKIHFNFHRTRNFVVIQQH